MYTINRSEVVRGFIQLGFNAAGQWNKDKTMEKILGLADMDAANHAEFSKFGDGFQGLIGIVSDADDGETPVIVIVNDSKKTTTVEEEKEEEAAPIVEDSKLLEDIKKKERKPMSKKTAKTTQPAGKGKKVTKKASAKAPAKEKAPKEKAPKEKAPAKEKAPKGPSRPYCAGQVLAKYGLEKGINDVMAKEVDKLYKKNENLKEAMCYLRTGWHAIRGYTGKKEDGEWEGTGVRPSETNNCYIIGKIIAKRGIEEGVTPGLVKEVSKKINNPEKTLKLMIRVARAPLEGWVAAQK